TDASARVRRLRPPAWDCSVERERALVLERPVPGGRAKPPDAGCSIGHVSVTGRTPRLVIPRWVQLVGLPLLLVLAWLVASATAHVVFLFVIAALVALLLDPIVRILERARIRRGISVAIVYLSFLAALVAIIAAIATAVVGQTKTAATRFNDYFTNVHEPSGQT